MKHISEIEVIVPPEGIGEFANAFQKEIDLSRFLQEVKDLVPSLETPIKAVLTKTLELTDAD